MFAEVVISLLLVWLVWFCITTYLERRTLPPGPFPFPWIGNLPVLLTNPVNPMRILRQKYGDIFTLTFVTGNTVFLNNATLMQEARLTRKDDILGILSEYFYPINIIVGSNDLVYADYGTVYLFRRKVFMSAMHVFGTGIEKAEEKVGFAVRSALERIESLNGQPFSAKDLAASAILIQLWEWITSKKVSFDDPTITSLFEFRDILVKQSWQSALYELLPFQSYLPTEFNRNIKRAQRIKDMIFPPEFKTHMESYVPGVIRDMTDSFISAYEKEIAKENAKDIGSINDIPGLMLDVALGGSDTTSATIAWFILYMVLYPDIQAKLHAELDQVVGNERLPCWEDAKDMHYLQATLCEVLRRSTPIPAARANAIRDVTLGGYRIPKGTLVVFNLSEIHLDKREWPQPDEFIPERFLNGDGNFVGWTSFHAFMPFSLGRRKCAGMRFAKIMMFTFTAAMLHHFKFELPYGVEKPSSEPPGLQIITSPNDFEVVAKKRC
ncbi:cytochrome P450 2C31-like [Dendronephthya gigantea]|uniref:cytochrome P450 2C31-like n=1 Tax=Dendronephthya gigantea TaxID=151771 RepID=UPI00106911E7|nr:cytochrome P450 2C31-like [Dendronephthya gigantea]